MQQVNIVLVIFLYIRQCLCELPFNESLPVPILPYEPVSEMKCNGSGMIDVNIIPPSSQTMRLDVLLYDGCSPPTSSLARMLAERNISVSSFRELVLYIDWSPDPSFFQDLLIDSLTIAIGEDLFNVQILEVLNNLRTLVLDGWSWGNIMLSTIPAETKLIEITLANGYSVGEWGGCSHLEYLSLRNWNVSSASDYWLKECRALQTLNIQATKSPDGLAKILRGNKSIKHLYVNHCELTYLPKEMLLLENLETLDVSDNMISYFELVWAPSLMKSQLKELNLQYNSLKKCLPLFNLFRYVPDLVSLTLADNPLDLCNCIPDSEKWILENYYRHPWPRSLRKLNATNTTTSELCLYNMDVEAMEEIDFSKTKISSLMLDFQPLSVVQNLWKVNLTGNCIYEISLQEPQYYNLPIIEKALEGNITVDCDCKNAWLARALRNQRLTISARCYDQTRLTDVHEDQLECDKYSCDACTCRRLWRDNTISAVCDGLLREVPRWEGLRDLWAPNNLVKAINVTELPQTLTLLNLRDNRIPHVSPAELAYLFAERERTVMLAGNPFVCDCAAQPLLLALSTHRDQVEDYDQITCVNDGRFMSEVALDELCPEPPGDRTWLVASPLIVVTTLAGLFAAYYRYERKIREFLFTRGYCLCCVHEDQLDDDRPYDAFVSFAHLDSEFVSEHLLPELETARGYRLCVHYRDWAAGGWIPEQISDSVRLSKRVIIVLSKNFLASMWALMEFRLAQVEALEERRTRLIVVVLEDVLEDQRITAEMRAYLAMNTYVKWGDPWFWEKLTFALPRKENQETQVKTV